MFCCCAEGEAMNVNVAFVGEPVSNEEQFEMFLDLPPPPAEPVTEPEPAMTRLVSPGPLVPHPPPDDMHTFVVEVEKKPGDDTVGLNVEYAGGQEAKAGVIVMVVNRGLIQTYNETAAAGQIVAAGNHIIEVNGVTTPADDMLAAIAKDTKLRIVFKAA